MNCAICGSTATWVTEDSFGVMNVPICDSCKNKKWLRPEQWALDYNLRLKNKPPKEYFEKIISETEFKQMVKRFAKCNPGCRTKLGKFYLTKIRTRIFKRKIIESRHTRIYKIENQIK